MQMFWPESTFSNCRWSDQHLVIQMQMFWPTPTSPKCGCSDKNQLTQSTDVLTNTNLSKIQIFWPASTGGKFRCYDWHKLFQNADVLISTNCSKMQMFWPEPTFPKCRWSDQHQQRERFFSTVLVFLLWLPVNYRIGFIVWVFVFISLHGLALSHISDLLGLQNTSQDHLISHF